LRVAAVTVLVFLYDGDDDRRENNNSNKRGEGGQGDDDDDDLEASASSLVEQVLLGAEESLPEEPALAHVADEHGQRIITRASGSNRGTNVRARADVGGDNLVENGVREVDAVKGQYDNARPGELACADVQRVEHFASGGVEVLPDGVGGSCRVGVQEFIGVHTCNTRNTGPQPPPEGLTSQITEMVTRVRVRVRVQVRVLF
jgi:hypothetical protein